MSNFTKPTNGALRGTAIQASDLPSSITSNTSGSAASLSSTLAITSGGTGQTTASAAFNALSPITSTGDLIIGNGTNSATRLGIGANTYVLTSNGTTATWAAPSSSSLSYRAGTVSISSGATSTAITFSSAFSSTSYACTVTMVNTTDTNVQFQPVIITSQSATGVTVKWNVGTSTANYSLAYTAIANN